MSFNLHNVEVGDILTCTALCGIAFGYAAEAGEVVGKFIVVSKQPFYNNSASGGPGLTLHIIQAKKDYPPISNNVGRNCTFRIGAMTSPTVVWNLDYRPEASI